MRPLGVQTAFTKVNDFSMSSGSLVRKPSVTVDQRFIGKSFYSTFRVAEGCSEQHVQEGHQRSPA